MQVHRSTGTTPFDLVLSRPPAQPLVDLRLLEHQPGEHARDRRVRVTEAKQAFLDRLNAAVTKARSNLERTQQRYKRNFDARVRQRLMDLKPGDYVYREIPEFPLGVSPKLASPVDGPYRVLDTDWPTVVVDVGGHPVRVNANRLVRAPTPRSSSEVSRLQLRDNAAQPEREAQVSNEVPVDSHPRSSREGLSSSEEGDMHVDTPARDSQQLQKRRASLRRSTQEQQRYVVEKLVGAGLNDEGTMLYRVRWEGYPPSADTWEPPMNLPHQLVRAYKRKHNLS